MIKIDRVVIVEGRYDKIKLSSILDAVIIETEGFGIFNNKEKQQLIRRLAETKGLLILTDSDSAGFKIRSFIRGIVPNELIKHAYIPDVFGKEKRKTEFFINSSLSPTCALSITLLDKTANIVTHSADQALSKTSTTPSFKRPPQCVYIHLKTDFSFILISCYPYSSIRLCFLIFSISFSTSFLTILESTL